MSTADLAQSTNILRRMAWVWLMVLVCFSLSFLNPSAWAQEPNRVDALYVRSDSSGVYIDAQMSLSLSSVMQETLDKGVSLYFLATADITRARWYWYDAVDVHETKTVRLSYQPLVRRYRVTIGGLSRSFDTLPEALNLLGYIANWRIADSKVLDASARQMLIFTFELDHKRLPRLFQVGVTKNKAWQLLLRQEVDLKVSLPEG